MLAVAGGKGGVGKTTSALAIAASLPGRPLVVDADRDMPDLPGLAGADGAPTLSAFLGEGAEPARAPGHDCRVLAAPPRDAPRTDRLLERLGDRLADWSESPASPQVVVDCPAGASVDAAAPLRVADAVLLVSTACAPALRDAAKTASMARAVDARVRGAVLTRTRLTPPGAADLLGCPVLASVPTVTGRPLDDPRVRDRYAAVAESLEPALTGETAELSGT